MLCRAHVHRTDTLGADRGKPLKFQNGLEEMEVWVYNGGMATKKQKTTRPWGNHLTQAIRVRVAPETAIALRRAKSLLGINIAAFVRAGVESALANSVSKVVAKIDDPRTGAAMKLRLIKYLRACTRSDFAMHHPELAERLRTALKR